MALKQRIPLLKWAKANGIGQTKAYEMAYCQKYKNAITKIDGRFKVDVDGMEKLLMRLGA